MISILNYGVGNLASIQNMLKKVGVSSCVISTADELRVSRVLIIPGVGKFDNGMENIDSLGLRQALDEAALIRKIPILGICLGMQLMTRGSEEGKLPGLGWIKADCCLIDGLSRGLPVPHMGWNIVNAVKDNPYFDTAIAEHRFYFVHSYAVRCERSENILSKTLYAEDFVSAFESDNLLGVQFHPEKSHKFGASFLRRFARHYDLSNAS